MRDECVLGHTKISSNFWQEITGEIWALYQEASLDAKRMGQYGTVTGWLLVPDAHTAGVSVGLGSGWDGS